MINFRYHVVSLTAVFLALAIGLVVGTAALNGPAVDALDGQVSSLRKQNQQYRDQVTHLEAETNQQEEFTADAAPYILGDRLSSRRVLVVSMSSSAKYVDGVLEMLKLSGAKVTGQVEIQDKFTDPANNEQLLDLAHISQPATVTGLPTNANGVESSAALLAAVLLDRNPPVPADATRTVLTSYTSGGWIVPTGDVTTPAEAVVVIAGPPYVDREAAKRNDAVVTIVDQFDKAAPIVVAANGTGGDGNVVAAVRRDPTLAKTISTVDTVATLQGRVVVVLAALEQIQGKTGQYGIGSGATARMPKAKAAQ